MSIRTTITLDEDVIERVKQQARANETPFRSTLNDLLRLALFQVEEKPKARVLKIEPARMGYQPGLNYDDIESLLEHGEGDEHR